jgi:hypothetical protein
MRCSIISISFAFLLAGCGFATPPIPYDGIAISEIVQRISCEIAYAVPDIQGPDPTGPFQWMKYWTARVDLTLQTTDAATANPQMVFTHPLTQTVVNRLSGSPFQRSVTVAAGGELQGTAERQEVLSFTLSVDELRRMRSSADCTLPDQLGLLGHLGLQEWIEAALTPVASKQLTVGYHAAPGAVSSTKPPTPKAATPSGGAPSGTIADQDMIASRNALTEAETYTETATIKAKLAKECDLFDGRKGGAVQEFRDRIMGTGCDADGTHCTTPSVVVSNSEMLAWNPSMKKAWATFSSKVVKKCPQNRIQTTADLVNFALADADLAQQKLNVASLLDWQATKLDQEGAAGVAELNNQCPGPNRASSCIDYVANLSKYRAKQRAWNANATGNDSCTGNDPTKCGCPAGTDPAKCVDIDPDLTKYYTSYENYLKNGPVKQLIADLNNQQIGLPWTVWNLLPHDPPIDSISHFLSFTIVTQANVTPNWTLVNFKGPGQTTPFAQAGRTKLNTLGIVLGEPATAGSNAPSAEQTRQLLFQRLQQLPGVVVVPQ